MPRTDPPHRPGDTVRLGDLVVTVVDVLGQGSFGCVLRVRDADGRDMAMKVEAVRPGTFSQLAHERRVYRALRKTPCVPRVHGFDEGPDRRYLVMDLLGPNLQEVLERSPEKRVPLRQTCILTMRVLDRLRDLHRAGLLHRDVKPQNFLLGAEVDRPGKTSVWAVDFGLVKPYWTRAGDHIPFRDDKPGLTGTPRFASTFAQAGHENGRRDDLESLLYLAAYLFRGSLPWQSLRLPKGTDLKSPSGKRLKNARILAAKRDMDPDELYRDMPRFPALARYVRGLAFDAEPDYDRVRATLKRTYAETFPSPPSGGT